MKQFGFIVCAIAAAISLFVFWPLFFVFALVAFFLRPEPPAPPATFVTAREVEMRRNDVPFFFWMWVAVGLTVIVLLKFG